MLLEHSMFIIWKELRQLLLLQRKNKVLPFYRLEAMDNKTSSIFRINFFHKYIHPNSRPKLHDYVFLQIISIVKIFHYQKWEN